MIDSSWESLKTRIKDRITEIRGIDGGMWHDQHIAIRAFKEVLTMMESIEEKQK
jgi:hypothetical protein